MKPHGMKLMPRMVLMSLDKRIENEINEAEHKAWESLARYKFQMFGYWAAIWVHLNRISGLKKPNPWRSLVKEARHARE